MKKEYTNPEIEIISLIIEDVITTSNATLGSSTLPGYTEDSGFLS